MEHDRNGHRTSVYFIDEQEWAAYQELLGFLKKNRYSFSRWINEQIDGTLEELRKEYGKHE